jgi:long-chain acyl-CoA synthetase
MSSRTQLPATVAEFAFRAIEFGERPAQRFKRDGAWHDASYAEVGAAAVEVAAGLIALGVQPGGRVCVLADTRPEWSPIQYGIAAAGAVTVPIYSSSSADECQWVIGDSGAVAVFCENAGQLAKVAQVADALPELRHTIVIDPDQAGTTTLADLRSPAVDQAAVDERVAATRLDEPALIIYTSGTTGRPKGCVLTHRNMIAGVQMAEAMAVARDDDVVYLFLPLAHVFAQIVQLGATNLGSVIAYCSGGPSAIVPDCAEVRPTYLPAVPRVFEKIYAAVAGKVPAELLGPAVQAGLAVRRLEAAGAPVPDELRQGFDRADAQLFAPVRALLGGRLRTAITGAAPIAPQILEFFHAAGVPVYEGYGLTETLALATLNLPGATKLGTIGRMDPGCEVRIADDGEILIRGDNVFPGYWRNADATADALVDGWLQSGDLGAIDDDGYVTITGRKKDIIITAGGKNLTPANLENDLRQSPLISQAVMHGDRRPYPVVLVTLDPEQVVPWAEAHGLPTDIAELSVHPQLRAAVEQVIDGANQKYATVAQVKKFAIIDHDFSIETGELTPTLKMKRNVISEKYASVFDQLYAEG